MQLLYSLSSAFPSQEVCVDTVVEFTAAEKILLSAFQLEERGQSPFSAEALIVTSWREYPRSFGLKGYEDQFPDSNRVLSCIMGERGLARRGWLGKMGQKLYNLTSQARQAVRRLQDGDDAALTEEPAKVGRDQERFLLGLLNSSAAQKFEQGLKEELTFADACRFWNLTEDLPSEALASRMGRVSIILGDVERLIRGDSITLTNGRVLTKDDLDWIRSLDDYLEGRFSRHLNLLRHRSVRN